jgi:hypothetical protein
MVQARFRESFARLDFLIRKQSFLELIDGSSPHRPSTDELVSPSSLLLHSAAARTVSLESDGCGGCLSFRSDGKSRAAQVLLLKQIEPHCAREEFQELCYCLTLRQLQALSFNGAAAAVRCNLCAVRCMLRAVRCMGISARWAGTSSQLPPPPL